MRRKKGMKIEKKILKKEEGYEGKAKQKKVKER